MKWKLDAVKMYVPGESSCREMPNSVTKQSSSAGGCKDHAGVGHSNSVHNKECTVTEIPDEVQRNPPAMKCHCSNCPTSQTGCKTGLRSSSIQKKSWFGALLFLVEHSQFGSEFRIVEDSGSTKGGCWVEQEAKRAAMQRLCQRPVALKNRQKCVRACFQPQDPAHI